MTLSGIRRDVFLDRYARKDDDGKAIETSPEQMWDRVAAAIAEVEAPEARAEWTARFRKALDGFKFVPGGRILAGAGTGQKVTFYNCLPPDQPVLTPEGYVPIAEVDARDQVITGQGRARVVTQVFAREADEPLYEVRVAGGAGLLRLTGNHPVLARRGGGDGAAWVRAADIVKGDLVGCLEPGGARRAGDGQAWHVRRDEPVGWSPWGGAQVLVRERRETYVGVAWQAVAAVERVPYCGTVYDLEVEEDHSFVTAGAIVSNCYVIPSPEDSRRGIMDSVGLMVEIMSRGGGVGVNLSSLRPRGSYVRGVNGTASGPVSWGEVYSTATGAVIQGGCFGPTVRIATDRGLVPAAELADRLERGERIAALTHEGPQAITWAFRNGVKPLLRVTTARGFQVEVTPDHRMGVLRDGALQTVPMRDLAVGDEVLTFLGDGAEGHEVALARPAYERSVMSTTLDEDVSLPERLGEELAYLIGYLHADGCVHHGRKVTWSAPKAIKMATADDRPEIRERLVTYARRLFGMEAKVEAGTDSCRNVSLYSRVLVHWLEANGLLKAKAEDVRVPEAVLRSPSRVQGAFFAGYFDADGCDRGRKGGYGIDSISLGMLRDLQTILAANGILSHIATTDRSAQGWQTIHRLIVSGAEFKARLEHFADMSLKMRGRPGFRNHRNGYPKAVWRSLGVPGRYYQGLWDSTKDHISYRALTRVRQRLLADGQVALATKVEMVLHYVPDSIVAVDMIGMRDVYDFEVAETHMLSGSGFYTSNSRRGALMLMLDDEHPDVEEFITVKKDLNRINNANLSVCVSDRFMEAVKKDAEWELKWEDKVYRTIRARELWSLICESAWASGEPGVVFMERYQKWSNTWYCEQIRCVNPCFVGSTRIATSRGLVTAEELYRTQEPLSVVTDLRAADEARGVVGGNRHARLGVQLREAVPVFKTRENTPVLKLVTGHGYEVTATPDHRFLTPAGYVRLDQLRPGDTLYLQSGEGAWSTERSLPLTGWGLTDRGLARLRAKVARGEADPPTAWSADLGRFLGWVVADGYTYTHHDKPSLGMVFGAQEQDLMPHFRELARRWFGVAGAVATRNHTTALMYDSNVARFALALGVSPKGGPEKTVPTSIWTAPRDAVIGFLQGLFTADGTVNRSSVDRKSCTVRLSSSSADLLRGVQQLLLNLGIVSRLHLRRKAGARLMPDSRRVPKVYSVAPQWELMIDKVNRDRFAAEVGFLTEAKQSKVTEYIASKARPSNSEPFVTTVREVEPAGVADVFDTTEPVTHSITVNGVITHQCGEQGLGPWGVCNLGAINIAAFVENKTFNWDALRETVAIATRFLDNVIEATEYYFDENEQQQRFGIRRTGLGSMGLADALIKLELRYGSPEAIAFCDRLYATVRDVAYRTSAEIAAVKGPFPAYDRDSYQAGHFIQQLPADVRGLIAANGIRNGVLLTQAPTGTTSLLAGVSSGIEPVYAFSFKRVDRTGTHVVYHELYQQWLEQHPGEPAAPYFVSADQLTPEEHVRMQAAIQSYVDASISKTVNAPNAHTIEEVKTLYTLAYDLGCKGVTYFRDGCRAGVLTKLEEDKPKAAAPPAEDDQVFPLGHKVNGRWGHIRPIERPARLIGFTERKQTPLGTLFLTLNTLDGHPVELFATIGKAGSDVSAFTEGIARLVSVALRSGVDPTEVANQLKGIGGSRSVGFGPGRVRSVPDAMGQFIEEILQQGEGKERPAEGRPHHNGHGRRGAHAARPVVEAVAPEVVGKALGHAHLPEEAGGEVHPGTFNLCPACGLHTLAYMEGCALCFSCGYSEC